MASDAPAVASPQPSEAPAPPDLDRSIDEVNLVGPHGGLELEVAGSITDQSCCISIRPDDSAAAKVDVRSVDDPIKTEPDESGESEIDDTDDESGSGSDDDSSSSSDDDGSSSSSSSSSSEEDEEEDVKGGDAVATEDSVEGSMQEETVAMLADEDEEVVVGPIKSKHETEDLPPVPQVEVSLEQHHQAMPVGVISSIMGTRVVVESSQQHSPLNEGSVLWITETRSPLGLVDELFGPVKSPYYIVRYNTEKEVPAGISVGTAVSSVLEFANYILNEKDLYKKGYDASGDNDEEATDEVEFSDDEKEAEYRQSLRKSKRATDETRIRDNETATKKRRNLKGPPTSGRSMNQDFTGKKRIEKMKGGPANDRWRHGRESAIDKMNNFKGAAVNDIVHGKHEYKNDKRGANFNGAPNHKQLMQPCGTRATSNQPVSSIPNFTRPPQVAANVERDTFVSSAGPGYTFGITYAVQPAIMQQAMQCFGDPSQQLLLQQTNGLLAHGSSPQQQYYNSTEMIMRGAQMNGLLNQQPQNTLCNQQQQQQQLQNQFLNCFANAMAFQQQQQLNPNIGAPSNFPCLGGLLNQQPVGPMSFGSAGQSNFGQGSFGFSNGPVCNNNIQNYQQPPVAMNQNGTQNYQQPPVAMNQNGIWPMQSTSSFGPPLGVGVGQSNSNVSQAPFGSSGCSSAGIINPCSGILLRPPMDSSLSIDDEGRVRPPVQVFNRGRTSSSRGRKHSLQSGRHS